MTSLGPRGRILVGSAYLLVQGTLVATAGARVDHVFGFRLAAESTTVRVGLARELSSPPASGKAAATNGGSRVTLAPIEDGRWTAHDAFGASRRIAFRDRVHEATLSTFDAPVEARVGAYAFLARMQAALDDVASHSPDDAETLALVAQVTVQRNGREPYTVELRSKPRLRKADPAGPHDGRDVNEIK